MSDAGSVVGTDVARCKRWTATQADWLVRVVVVVGALVNAAAGVLSLFAPERFLALVGHAGESLSPGAQMFAAYTGTRDLAVALMLIALLAVRSKQMLAGVMLLTALANALDGVDAVAHQRWAQAPGALVFAIVFLLAACWPLRRSGRRTLA
jgi:hypothetical protein